MSPWDNFMYGHRSHDNRRSNNQGIESILRTLDIGTVVGLGIGSFPFFNAKFSHYDPEANLVFFSLPQATTLTSLTVEADKIDFIQKFETIVPGRE